MMEKKYKSNKNLQRIRREKREKETGKRKKYKTIEGGRKEKGWEVKVSDRWLARPSQGFADVKRN